MAVILLLGVQKHHQTQRFLTALKQRVYAMKELHLTEDDIIPYFIPSEGSIGEIVIFVEELSETRVKVHNELAERLAECAESYCERPRLVKCIIRPFDSRSGYACIVTK